LDASLAPKTNPGSPGASETAPPTQTTRRALLGYRIFALALMALLMVRLAWISDDSLITMRTALNTANGWGPYFNPAEAVQAYTHPLWYLLWVLVGSATGQWVVGILLLSVALSTVAVAIVLWSAPGPPIVIVASALLVMSNSFMEYTSSGLENPLAYLFSGLIVTLTMRFGRTPLPAWAEAFLLGLASAGLALTRLDLILLILPAAAWFVWTHRREPRLVLAGAAGLTAPLLAWFGWSYAIYSALLPNTFEAKRNLAIPAQELIFQGVRYIWVSIEFDPISGLIVLSGLLLAFLWGGVWHRLWATGAAIYLVYVAYVGGDFMVGRFLAVPVYLLVLLAASNPLWTERRRSAHTDASGSALVGATMVGVFLVLAGAGRPPVAITSPTAARWSHESAAGVADERGNWLEHSRTLSQMVWATSQPVVPPFQSAAANDPYRSLLDINSAASAWPQAESRDGSTPAEVGAICGGLGSVGILSGPSTHWVDPCALTDRFLAAQPYEATNMQWRVGHYVRGLPEGYLEAIQSGDPSKVRDPALATELAELWARIRQ